MSGPGDEVPPPDEPVAEEDRDAPPRGFGELAFKAPCRFCHAEVFVAKCDDGRMRTFDLADCPPTVEGVWVWHRRHGMQEYARFGRPPHPGESLIPGKRLHYCAEYSEARMRLELSGGVTPSATPSAPDVDGRSRSTRPRF